MAPEPITVEAETPVAEAMKIIYNEGVLRLPVTERGKLVGVISRSDIIRAAGDLRSLERLPLILFG
jgi:CIC family chloride channel protein